MGSLVHSRECGKANAVYVPSFEADFVAFFLFFAHCITGEKALR